MDDIAPIPFVRNEIPMKELTPLESFQLKQTILIDRVVESIKGTSRGIYLHGQGGTGKTYTVERTLREYLDDNEWVVFRGKVTAGGIRTFIKQCETAGVQVILFDDVAAILKNQDAIAIIQAAWDGQVISYARQGQHHSFTYSAQSSSSPISLCPTMPPLAPSNRRSQLEIQSDQR